MDISPAQVKRKKSRVWLLETRKLCLAGVTSLSKVIYCSESVPGRLLGSQSVLWGSSSCHVQWTDQAGLYEHATLSREYGAFRDTKTNGGISQMRDFVLGMFIIASATYTTSSGSSPLLLIILLMIQQRDRIILIIPSKEKFKRQTCENCPSI